MLKLDGLAFSYDSREVLRDITFHLKAGDLVSVLGINGSGKTTLLKTINRILRPHQGTVLVDQKDVQTMNRKQIARIMGYMPQKSNGVPCTVFDAVLLGRRPHLDWDIKDHDLEVTRNMLKLTGLEEYALRATTELSGGEFQKVIIARALTQEPKILLLDEPINHLDMKNQFEIMTLLRDITKRLGLITITVMHDLNTALRFSDGFFILKQGRLFACGDRSVITAETIRQTHNIEVIVTEIEGIPLVIPLSPAHSGHSLS